MNKWDEDYLALAEFWAKRKSKDPSTQTGAVIVRDNCILAIGYNGFPKGIADTKERLEDRNTKLKLIVHCEMNAIVNYPVSMKGATLYTWPFMSCSQCAKHMIQAGITKAVAPKVPDDKKERWAEDMGLAKALFEEAGVEVVEV